MWMPHATAGALGEVPISRISNTIVSEAVSTSKCIDVSPEYTLVPDRFQSMLAPGDRKSYDVKEGSRVRLSMETNGMRTSRSKRRVIVAPSHNVHSRQDADPLLAGPEERHDVDGAREGGQDQRAGGEDPRSSEVDVPASAAALRDDEGDRPRLVRRPGWQRDRVVGLQEDADGVRQGDSVQPDGRERSRRHRLRPVAVRVHVRVDDERVADVPAARDGDVVTADDDGRVAWCAV